LLVAKTESDLQLFGNPLWVEIDSDLPENALVVEIRHLVPCFRLWTRKMPELAMCASAKQCPLCTR